MQNVTRGDNDDAQVLHVDPEHARLRTAVVALMVTAVPGSFFLLNWLLPMVIDPAFTPLVPCVVALPLGLGLAWLGEQGLKRIWPSGKTISLHSEGLRVDIGRPSGPQTFLWQVRWTFMGWFFVVGDGVQLGRERRVSPKWVCLAGQLRQDEAQVTVYTYAPRHKAEQIMAITIGRLFHALPREEIFKKPDMLARLGPPTAPQIPNEVLAGTDGRIWLAEKERLQMGLELRPDDFETLVTAVDKNS